MDRPLRSSAGDVGCNPTRIMDVSVLLFCLFCPSAGLAAG
jgi:hypothetical protein